MSSANKTFTKLLYNYFNGVSITSSPLSKKQVSDNLMMKQRLSIKYKSKKRITPLFIFCMIFSINLINTNISFSAEQAKTSPKKISLSQTVKFIAHDKFMLGADYYPAHTKNKQSRNSRARGAGVLILHDCHHSSKNYTALAERLAQQGIHVLAPNFRGYGTSSSTLFSHEKIKTESKNIIDYQGAVASLTSYWEEDTLAAYNYLLKKVDKKRGISIFSSGCSPIYGVTLAEKMHLKSMVMITPKMNYADKERYKNLIDIPTYFINASHHTETIETSKELFEWNGSVYSKIQIFNSDSHDYGLLQRNKYLIEDIASWLRYTLER